jgi:membrane associated rhomboid family serine protease/Ca2+-binding EF-hand superfamily protein
MGTEFHLTEEMLERSVGCGTISKYFTAYPNEYYDKFDYSAGMVPTRLFSWCLGHASFDSLRMNMLFMLFLGIEAETLHGGWQLLHMFLVTALTGGIYTLCFANGAMLGAESLVYALIALLFLNLKTKMKVKGTIRREEKISVTQVIGCLLFIGIQVRVLYTEYSKDLEDGVSQTGHIVAGTVGVLSWWLIHNRNTVMTWADSTVVEKLRSDLMERKKRAQEEAARARKELRDQLYPEAYRLFRMVDDDGNEVLDSDEVLRLGDLLGIQMDSKAIDTVMREILDPDGTKVLDADDMLVDFEEFFEWYIKQHEGAMGGWDGLKRAFDSAKGKRDIARSRTDETRQVRELDDAQEAYDHVCENPGLSRKALKDLIDRLSLTLSRDVQRDVLKEMERNDKQDIDFVDFEKWWKKNTGGGGARAVDSGSKGGGKLREYFADLRQKLKENNRLLDDDDEGGGAVKEKSLKREARTLFNEFVDRKDGKMTKRLFEGMMLELGYEFSGSSGADKLGDLMMEMTTSDDGKVTGDEFEDWWLDNCETFHKDLKKYMTRRADSDFDDDEGLFGSDDDDNLTAGSRKKRILSKYQRKGARPSRTSSGSKRKEMKFTFRIEDNPQLFSGRDKICTVRAKDMDDLKKNLKYDLRIESRTDIDVYYYDEAFKGDVKPRDLEDLFVASKGVCPKGGHKLSIHVVDARVGLRR